MAKDGFLEKEMKEATMVYAPVDDKYNLPGRSFQGDGYYYMVVDKEDVKSCVKDGWCEEPSKLPKKRKSRKPEETE